MVGGRETYTLKLAIDDSSIRGLEQKLSSMFGLKSGLGGTGGSGEGSSTNMVKNITKLGVIAAGIGGLLTLVKKIADMTVSASPMLQAMLKLFDTSITLILRPIGDFIGFTLRPIMMFFLLYVAIPFYRYFTPILQTLGSGFGNTILKFLSGGLKFNMQNIPSTIALSLNPVALSQMLGNWIKDQLGNTKLDLLGDLTTAFNTYKTQWQSFFGLISGLITDISNLISPIKSSVSKTISTITSTWDMFVSLFEGFGGGIKTLMSGWDKLYGFFQPIANIITNVFTKAWQTLTDFFQAILNFFKDPIGTLLKGITGTNTSATSSPTSSSSNPLAQAGMNIEHLVINATTTLTDDAVSFLKDPIGFIAKQVQNSIRRTNTK